MDWSIRATPARPIHNHRGEKTLVRVCLVILLSQPVGSAQNVCFHPLRIRGDRGNQPEFFSCSTPVGRYAFRGQLLCDSRSWSALEYV